MACECVVLGSQVSGVTDILKDFPDYQFEASHIETLAAKIKAVKHMPIKERQEVALNMRKQVIKEFSIEEFIKNHETLYLDLVK